MLGESDWNAWKKMWIYNYGSFQVNITLLDINDNYPVWKDEPYFINLVEMTPPNSDVTTVGVQVYNTHSPVLWFFYF